jgi:hypothetical protein
MLIAPHELELCRRRAFVRRPSNDHGVRGIRTRRGIRPATVYGQTDEFGFNIARDPVHVHDLNATLLHLLGFDHERLTYRTQGRDFRLTDVHGRVIEALLA